MELTEDDCAPFAVHIGSRTGEITSSADLLNYTLSGRSKLWACKGLMNELGSDDNWTTLQIPNDCHAVTSFCRLFNLPVQTVREWLRHYKSNSHLHELPGCPRSIDLDLVLGIKTQLMEVRPRPNRLQLVQMLIIALRETAKRRGSSMIEIDKINKITSSTFKRYCDEFDFRERLAQPVFPERAKALADKRLCCCWVIIYFAFFAHLPSYKKFNSDQSLVGVDVKGSGGMRVWIAQEEELNSHDRLVLENPQVSDLRRNYVFIYSLFCHLYYTYFFIFLFL
jgi:hypothetical protein